MPTDIRIALLIVGIILLAVAVIGAAVAAARKNSLRSGHIQRALVAVVGAALIVWSVTLWPPRERQLPAAAVPAPKPAAATAAPSAAAAGAQAAAPTAAPAHPDLLILARSAFDACAAPTRPADVPDGAAATLVQMKASQAATKGFDAATDAYQSCLSTAAANFVRQYGPGMSQANLQAVDALHTKINNAAVDVDQSVADRFNQQLRIFKARPGSSAAR